MPSILKTVSDSSDFEYSTTLGGLEYIVRITWNEVNNSWYMSLKDYSGAEVTSGIRIVTGWPLVTIYKSQNIPDGMIICNQTTEGSLITPTRDSFNDGTHRLLYLTEAEIREALT